MEAPVRWLSFLIVTAFAFLFIAFMFISLILLGDSKALSVGLG